MHGVWNLANNGKKKSNHKAKKDTATFAVAHALSPVFFYPRAATLINTASTRYSATSSENIGARAWETRFPPQNIPKR